MMRCLRTPDFFAFIFLLPSIPPRCRAADIAATSPMAMAARVAICRQGTLRHFRREQHCFATIAAQAATPRAIYLMRDAPITAHRGPRAVAFTACRDEFTPLPTRRGRPKRFRFTLCLSRRLTYVTSFISLPRSLMTISFRAASMRRHSSACHFAAGL